MPQTNLIRPWWVVGMLGLATVLVGPAIAAEGIEPNRSETDTPLHTALKELTDDPSKISELLRNGADPNIMTPSGETPLTLAANSIRANAYGVVEELIRYGADVNQPDDRQCEPIAIAALAKNVAVVDLLIRNGADVHGRDTPCVPLVWAHFGQDSQVIALLEKYGAKVPDRIKQVTSELSSSADRHAELLSEPVPEGMDRAEFSMRQTIKVLMEDLGHLPRWKYELEERLRIMEANPRGQGVSRQDWKDKIRAEAKAKALAKFGSGGAAQ